jgi:hypothetical protein
MSALKSGSRLFPPGGSCRPVCSFRNHEVTRHPSAVNPIRTTTVQFTASGSFTGAGAGAPRTVDYDPVSKLLISSVKGAPVILLDMTTITATPATTIRGLAVGNSGLTGCDFLGSQLDVTYRWAHFVCQQEQLPSRPGVWNIGVSFPRVN